ncbi:tRNA (adenosine(37)-N6)-threonylcarbamoyltransferase complex dimerization subunit type 1 TsaB [Candidatus Dependentiae bacterium]|nr:tRNA (adenosine(37)-N6)-threonylcarbamoyltransferase complex dimerization subunit type 1 TsaB [Candidatus Dependentiae bacterium]MCC7414527.1 tRNA (adenosine(37)-N6)-threonylcarbamoyltransferase complex dimerization subunit type 1 TsaB [Campylobacterota bacterium]
MHIVLNSTYSMVEVALCSHTTVVDALCVDKFQASGQLLVALAELCRRQSITSNQIDFIVANAGPGPFTTLRTVLATANGLAMAQNLTCVAVDGLRALLDEYRTTEYPVTVALLNAYSGDLYYAVDSDGQIMTGILYGSEELKKLLQQLTETTIRFIGNGVHSHEALIREMLGGRVHIPTPNPETCSLQIVATNGYQQWRAQEHVSEQLVPLYLKNYSS